RAAHSDAPSPASPAGVPKRSTSSVIEQYQKCPTVRVGPSRTAPRISRQPASSRGLSQYPDAPASSMYDDCATSSMGPVIIILDTGDHRVTELAAHPRFSHH